jgi:hypothetical protein
MTAATNKILIYSNAALQGQRSDWHMMRRFGAKHMPQLASGNQRASGVLWKTAAVNILPKVLMFALLAGLLDDLLGDEPREILERGSSEYDRTNYIVVPLGKDGENGVVLRVPQDFSGQFASGLFWKLLNMARGDRTVMDTISQVLDYTGGQMPSATPMWGLVESTGQMATGRNPYDAYRGRQVLTDEEQLVRGTEAWKKFIGWEFQQVGGGIVWKFYAGEQPRDKTPLQQVLELPVLSNVVGRSIKSSSYGVVEEQRRQQQAIQREEASANRRDWDRVADAVADLRKLPDNEVTPGVIHRKAQEIVKELYGDESATEQNRQRADILRKIRTSLARAKGDPLVDSVLRARSIAQKTAVIVGAAKKMSDEEFDAWMENAHREGVVSDQLRKSVRAARNRQ